MPTESLIIDMDLQNASVNQSLAATQGHLTDLDNQTQSNDSSFQQLSRTAAGVGKALAKTVTAGFALATALTTVVLASAASTRELSNLATTADMTKEEFEALSFAFKQFGVDSKGTADAINDVKERLGEFASAGTGPFQDFADVMKLTKEEARALASEMQFMSGDEAIGAMVSQMEEANVAQAQMSFVMKSMSNDLEYASSLFTDQSSRLKELKSNFKEATEQLKLTSGQISNLREAATSFDLMTSSLSKAGSLISSQLAPLLTEFFNDVINVVPDATKTIVDFVNSFKDPESIESVEGVNAQILESQRLTSALRQEQSKAGAVTRNFRDGTASLAKESENQSEKIKVQIERTKGLVAQREKLIEQKKKEDAESLKKNQIGGLGFGESGVGSGSGDEIQAIADRFKTEEELLFTKLENERAIVGEDNQLRLELEQEYQDNLAAIHLAANEESLAQGEELKGMFEQNQEDEADAAVDSAKTKRQSDEQYFSLASNLNTALLNDNKALNAGLIIADTASAIMASLKINPYDYLNVAVIAATGAAQLSTLGSSGGGSGASGGSGNTAPEPDPTTELTVSNTDESGPSQSQVMTIRVEADDDELAVALNGILKQGKVNGRIS